MYSLNYKDGLLYASVELTFGSKSTLVENVIIDTGAFHTIILTDYLDDLDIEFTENDELIKASGYGGIQF